MPLLKYELMEKVETDIPDALENITIHDPLTVDWGDFKFTGKEQNKVLTKFEIERPDMLSYDFYLTVVYQDIIFLVNNLGDIFETPVKTIMKMPRVEDLKQFIFENRKV
jgi:hypothetical protein